MAPAPTRSAPTQITSTSTKLERKKVMESARGKTMFTRMAWLA